MHTDVLSSDCVARAEPEGRGPASSGAGPLLCTAPRARHLRRRRTLTPLPRGYVHRGDQQEPPGARPAHLCSRHQRPAGRSQRHRPASTSTRSCSPWSWSRNWRPSGTIRNSDTSPARRCGCSTSTASGSGGSTPPFRSGSSADRCGSSSTTPIPASCRPGSGSATTTPASSRWPATSRPRGTTSPSSPRTCRCGSRRRRSACSRRSTAPSWPSRLRLDRDGGTPGLAPPGGRAVRRGGHRRPGRRRAARCTPAWCSSPSAARRSAG